MDLQKITNKQPKSTPKPAAVEEWLKKDIYLFGPSFSSKKKEDFFIELGVLLNAGITLKEALGLLATSVKKKKEKELYQFLTEELVLGRSLSEVMAMRSEFTPYEHQSVRIGEETGTLAQVATQLGNYYQRKNEQKRALIAALTYPIIILITASLVVAFMLRYVVPMFKDIFTQNRVELPLITKLIIVLSEFIGRFGWLLLPLIILVILSYRVLSKRQSFKRLIHYAQLRLPVIGNFIKVVYLSQFAQAISLLTASRIPVVNGIRLTKDMIDFAPLKDVLEGVEASLLKGKSLSESMRGNRMFSDKMIALVKVAEETNQTEYIFGRLNAQYALEVQQKSKQLSTLLEPFIIVLVGIFVGVILISMYLPMFKLSSVLG